MEICYIFFLKLFARTDLPRSIFSFVRRGVPQISSLLQKRDVLRADCYILWTFPPTFPFDGLCPQWMSLKHSFLVFFGESPLHHICIFWNRRKKKKSPSTFPARYEMIRTDDIDFMIMRLLALRFSIGPPVRICVHCYWDCGIFLMV